MAFFSARSGLVLSLLAFSCFAGTATASADTTADLSVTAQQQDPNDQATALSPVAAGDDSTEETPEISTGEWSRSQTRLAVEAEVTPTGAGEVYFEYGRTSGYGSKTDAQAVSGSEKKTVKSVLAGLKMSTLYHYRAVLVVGGKTYYGKNVKARTLGVLKYGPLTLKAAKRSPKSVRYVGTLGDGMADAPGACKGTVTVMVYTLGGADLLRRTTRMKSDCTYAITIPFGRSQASKYGKKGSVLTQARFSGNKAVSSVGSDADRP